MSADENLHPVQFMPIEQVGAMHSQYRGKTVEQAYHGPERFDEISQEHSRAKGFESAEAEHEALKAHIAEHGMTNPLGYDEHLGNRFLGNGHHRYFAARDLGVTHMAVRNRDARVPLKPAPGWDPDREAGE